MITEHFDIYNNVCIFEINLDYGYYYFEYENHKLIHKYTWNIQS